MANKKYKDPKKVITGPQTRWSFVHVWEPVKVGDDDNAKLKYSISLIIPKDDTRTLKAIEKAMQAAYDEGIDKLKSNGRPAPSFKAVKKPLNPIIDRDEVYSGCYGRASITFCVYNYKNGMSKGIGCYLNNLQKVSDGEPLGGMRASAEEDFADDDYDDDDFLT